MDREEYFAWQRQEADRRHADAMRLRDQAHERARQDHDRHIQAQIQRDQQARWDHDASLRAQHDRIQETNRLIAQSRNPRNDLVSHRDAQVRHYINQAYGLNPGQTVDPGRFPHKVETHSWWQFWKK